jgi:hypothetical protein
MNLSKFLYYFFLPIYKPGENLRKLTRDEHKIAYGFWIYFLLGALYTFTVYIGWRNGFGAVTESFIKIPAEEYYFYQTFYQIPIFIFGGILLAGTARLVATIFKGEGTYENLFAISAVALTFPMFLLLWLPETLLMVVFPDQRLTPLGGFDIFPLWFDNLRIILGFVWPLAIIVWGIVISENVSWVKAVLITIVGAIPMVVLITVFIR